MDFLHLCVIYLQLLTILLIVFFRNPIHSILLLIILFFELTFVLIFFNIEFISLLLIVVYVGAVAVLFLFVVMMLQVKAELFNSFYIILISFILSLFFYFENIYFSGSSNVLVGAVPSSCIELSVFFVLSRTNLVLLKKNKLVKKRSNILKKRLSTFNPHVRLPKQLILLIESKTFQIIFLIALLMVHYIYIFHFVVVIPSLMGHLVLFFLVILCFFCLLSRLAQLFLVK
jgi:hypothetical protein